VLVDESKPKTVEARTKDSSSTRLSGGAAHKATESPVDLPSGPSMQDGASTAQDIDALSRTAVAALDSKEITERKGNCDEEPTAQLDTTGETDNESADALRVEAVAISTAVAKLVFSKGWLQLLHSSTAYTTSIEGCAASLRAWQCEKRSIETTPVKIAA
jgi:hypothetical protein